MSRDSTFYITATYDLNGTVYPLLLNQRIEKHEGFGPTFISGKGINNGSRIQVMIPKTAVLKTLKLISPDGHQANLRSYSAFPYDDTFLRIGREKAYADGIRYIKIDAFPSFESLLQDDDRDEYKKADKRHYNLIKGLERQL